ncbi:MAG TPA: hypothetical protein PLF81_02885 [Candidatus Anammoximicrobium sp.]|nr:hypothetical protein [Candidatus Anammoximicrobium sp.]
MSAIETPTRLVDEIADFLASSPTREQLLSFRPSEAVQQHVRELLTKSSQGILTAEEERELSQLEQAELLMRLVKSRIHSRTPS